MMKPDDILRMEELRAELPAVSRPDYPFPDVPARLRAEYRRLRRRMEEEEPVITLRFYPKTGQLHLIKNGRMLRARLVPWTAGEFLDKLKIIIP